MWAATAPSWPPTPTASPTEGQIALAKFTNTQGLGSDGNNKWVANDSGPALNGSAQRHLRLAAGRALEESNVDLTAELVNMMTAQRSYQANAQTIKTQDQVFSTLVNLR
jgi:flagellar hook protein FlgE